MDPILSIIIMIILVFTLRGLFQTRAKDFVEDRDQMDDSIDWDESIESVYQPEKDRSFAEKENQSEAPETQLKVIRRKKPSTYRKKRLDYRQGMVMKEILDPPRAKKPFRFRMHR